MMGDSITRLHTLSERYNTIQDSINEVHRSERELAILRSRRIIVSTTTAAAMQIDLYALRIQTSSWSRKLAKSSSRTCWRP